MKKFLSALSISAFACVASATVAIYPHKMSPRESADDSRRLVKPPASAEAGGATAFSSIRHIPRTADISKEFDKYEQLGNYAWLNYQTLFDDRVDTIIDEIKKRGFRLFDIWGFVPGSGAGKEPWIQFTPPERVLENAEKSLGENWLGMDNGEQDYRYMRCFSFSTYQPDDDFSRYVDFHRHFERLGNCLDNKMAALLGLNFGHYFLKEGLYTYIGAETGQKLPNTQIYYSFIRGAGKQYGVPWFGNVSVFNRWGYKNYSGTGGGSPEHGTSLSLMKRLMYSHLMYNCSIAGFEMSFFMPDGSLSPIGKIQREAKIWAEKNRDLGVMQTPVALLFDFRSGWMFPRAGKAPYMKWGNSPFGRGEYMADAILDTIYPDYRDCSYFRNELGYICPTPFGDIADCVLSDISAAQLKKYPFVIVATNLKYSDELAETLRQYVRSGGSLTISAAPLSKVNGGIGGIKAAGEVFESSAKMRIGAEEVAEDEIYELQKLELPPNAEVLKNADGQTVFASVEYGRGRVNAFASPFLISAKQTGVATYEKFREQNAPLPVPFKMLRHAKILLAKELSKANVFETNPELSLIVCAKSEKDFTVAVLNNSFGEKKFFLKSKCGEIASLREIPIDRSERSAAGFLPFGVKAELGKNSENTIAGGDIRIFEVSLKNPDIKILPKNIDPPNPEGETLELGEIIDLRREILKRPTFFRHYDTVAVDWKYLEVRTKSALREEGQWAKRIGLKTAVNFASGINLFPDLRITDNDPAEYKKSLKRIKAVVEKAAVWGAGKIYITLQRMPENNYSPDRYDSDAVKTFERIADFAEKFGIDVVLIPHFGRDKNFPVWGGFPDIKYNKNVRDIALRVARKNFKYAVNPALLEHCGELEAFGRGEFESAAETVNALKKTDIHGLPYMFETKSFSTRK